MDDLNKCTKCGAETHTDTKFCIECGTELETPKTTSETKRHCSQCGSDIPLGVDFCTECGAEVTTGRGPQKRPDRPKAKAQARKVTPQSEERRKNGLIALLISVPLAVVLLWNMVGDQGPATPPRGMTARQNAGTPAPGDTSGMMENIDQKITDLKFRVANDSTDFHALMELGEIYAMVNMLEQAGDYFRRYVETRPEDTLIRLRLAEIYANLNLIENSITQLDAVLEIDPVNLLALYNSGIIKASSGDSEGAIKMWEKILEISPEGNMAHSAQENIKQLKSQN